MSVSPQQLRALNEARDLVLPVEIELQADQDKVLSAFEILRLLPGKRLVFRGIWSGRRVVAKLFLDARRGRRHYERERFGVQVLQAAALPTPPLLFSGTTGSGLPLLIFAELMPAWNLLQGWGKTDFYGKQQLLTAVALTLAEHHQAGLKQIDNHWGNFLLYDGRIFTLDGDAVDTGLLGQPLNRRNGRENLARFLAEGEPELPAMLGEIWRAYCQARSWPDPELDLDDLRRCRLACSRRKAEKFSAKTTRNCTAVRASKENGFFTLIDRRYQDADLAALPEAFPDLRAAGSLLKDGNSATVVRLEWGGLDLVVKRYNIKNFRHALSRCWRPSRALLSWRNAQRLSWWRIAQPRPLAMLEKHRAGLRGEAYFISEYVAGSDAGRLLPELSPDDPALSHWLKAFAALLGRLLEIGITQGDCKASNYRCGRDDRLYLLDLDAMQYWPRRDAAFRRVVAKDHGRLLANWEKDSWLHRGFSRILRDLKDKI